MRHLAAVAGAALLSTLVSGCIQSDKPILSDNAQPFGKTLTVQLYGLTGGFARDPQRVSFVWNGHHYARAGGKPRDINDFSILPFEGDDFSVQTVPDKPRQPIEFALAHRLADGVWQVVAIDEADADAPTRSALCKTSTSSACTIETRQQLLAFARATAAQHKSNGGLAIRLADGEEKKPPHRRR